MPNNITLQRVSPYSGAYPENTSFETEQQVGGEHRPVIKVGESALPTGAATETTLASLLANQKDFGVLVARGNITGYSRVNKFGAAPQGIQTTTTDIWSRADATPTQQIWIAPTQARIHAIASSSAQDAAGGTGAASVIVYGLKTWASAETNETITLTGATPVNTANSYVIIHRMKVVGQATTTGVGVNIGTITATAATDNTITAVILPGDGQTEMAIYGVPSGYTFFLKRFAAAVSRCCYR